MKQRNVTPRATPPTLKPNSLVGVETTCFRNYQEFIQVLCSNKTNSFKEQFQDKLQASLDAAKQRHAEQLESVEEQHKEALAALQAISHNIHAGAI